MEVKLKEREKCLAVWCQHILVSKCDWLFNDLLTHVITLTITLMELTNQNSKQKHITHVKHMELTCIINFAICFAFWHSMRIKSFSLIACFSFYLEANKTKAGPYTWKCHPQDSHTKNIVCHSTTHKLRYVHESEFPVSLTYVIFYVLW